MRYKPLKYDFRLNRIPRRGAPPEDCPLTGGEEVSFLDCLECEYFIDFETHEYSHCGIKEEEEKRRHAKEMEVKRREEEKFEREIAERDAKSEEEDRKMREEMSDLRDEMKKNREKWEKEYEKEQEEYEKKEEERKDMERRSLTQLFGEDLVESSERFIERMGSGKSKDEEENEEDDDEEVW